MNLCSKIYLCLLVGFHNVPIGGTHDWVCHGMFWRLWGGVRIFLRQSTEVRAQSRYHLFW